MTTIQNESINKIAGYSKEKQQIKEMQNMLLHLKDYEKSGIRIPRGVLLYGIPGVGKTQLARSVICEGISSVELCAADCVGADTGEKIQTAFKKAKEKVPCVLIVDELALSPGVELSYLDEEIQYSLLEIMEREDCTPSYSQAWRLHNAFRDGTLTEETLDNIMSEEKANQRETFRIPAEKLQSVLPKGVTGRRAEEYVLKACEFYKKYLQKKKEQCL